MNWTIMTPFGIHPGKAVVFLVALLISSNAVAQTPKDEVGTWFMLLNQNPFHKMWSLHTEVQGRSYELAANSSEFIARMAINWHVDSTNKHRLSAGYAYFETYPFDKETGNRVRREHRVWEQFATNTSISRFNFQHRIWQEQRFFEDGEYQDRSRYRLTVTIPINNKTIEPKTIFLAGFNEIFIAIQRTNQFNQNWLYGGLGYQFAENGNIQAGYLNQTIGADYFHRVSVSVIYNIDLRSKSSGSSTI